MPRKEKPKRIPLFTWVPADDLRPLGSHEVLCTDLEGIWIGRYSSMGEWLRDDEPVDVVVTHWQELPELPEEAP